MKGLEYGSLVGSDVGLRGVCGDCVYVGHVCLTLGDTVGHTVMRVVGIREGAHDDGVLVAAIEAETTLGRPEGGRVGATVGPNEYRRTAVVEGNAVGCRYVTDLSI